eukprot:TCONS_00056507-protein
MFDLLADEEENSLDANQSKNDEPQEQQSQSQEQEVTTKKKNKKRKNKKKNKSPSKDDTNIDDSELDEIDRANLMLGVTPRTDMDSTDGSGKQPFRNKSLLSVDARNLNPANEMKRRFGASVVDQDRRRNPHERRFKRLTRLVVPKDNWPPYSKQGITMCEDRSDETMSSLFTFEHQETYQKIQFKFYDAVESMDHNNIIALLNMYPYHIDSMLQLSEVCRHNEDVQMASELVERALYVFECNFHTLFNIALGTCRLNYKRAESRPFFLALFRHIKYVGDRACYRTALEFCKLLLGLDPEEDPLCTLLMIDYYAIKAEEYAYFIQLFDEYETLRNISMLPNFLYSFALAKFYQGKTEEANKAIRKALIRFPSLFVELMDKCGVSVDDTLRHFPLFDPVSYIQQSKPLNALCALYIGRSHVLWKAPEVIDWIVSAAKRIMDENDQHAGDIKQAKIMRETKYNRIPNNVLRHILISEIKEALTNLSATIRNQTIMTHDPLPPEDSVTGYSRPDRPQGSQDQRNLLSLFFQSIMPSFDQAENERLARGQQDEARAIPNEAGEGNVLRDGAEGLMNAMRELLHTMTFRNDGQEGDGQANQDNDGEVEQQWEEDDQDWN